MKTDVTSCIIIDTRRKRKDCLYPVKLRVTFNRYSKYYSLGTALSNDDFNKVMGKAPRGKLHLLKKQFQNEQDRSINIIDQIDYFSFEKFEEAFFFKKKSIVDILELIDERKLHLKKEERIKTAWGYQSLASSLKQFKGKSTIPINQINIAFLNDYEKWMLSNGRSLTTVGIYLRNLRATFNGAIEKKLIAPEYYPFGKNKYQIPSGRNTKKALSKQNVLKIINYKPKDKISTFCKDIWVFSYLANGMNITDIANLKYDDIEGSFIVFIRQKTKRTTKQKTQEIKVYINSEIKKIIQRSGNSTEKTYVFPILKPGMTTIERIRRIDTTIRSINYHMKKIGKVLSIKKKVTTYTARHTFSTVLKREGASIEFISEALGHQSILTTRSYLDSFDDTEKKRWAKKLL